MASASLPWYGGDPLAPRRIDVRTVQAWLGHESLATTQKYLEPSRDTEKALSKMRLPF